MKNRPEFIALPEQYFSAVPCLYCSRTIDLIAASPEASTDNDTDLSQVREAFQNFEIPMVAYAGLSRRITYQATIE